MVLHHDFLATRLPHSPLPSPLLEVLIRREQLLLRVMVAIVEIFSPVCEGSTPFFSNLRVI